MAVRVVVDSSAGLPPEVVRELDITVADMHVMGSGEDKGTSGLSSLELAACYARQLERGDDDGVIALHLSKALSSTWSAAVAASAVFPGTVKVVETDAAGMTIGAAAMAAATVAQEGGDLAACEAMAKSTLARSETWVYLHQLDDLRKSGRLPTGTAVLSAATFSLAHGSLDPWILLDLAAFAVAAVLLTWRTGGLEAAVALAPLLADGVPTVLLGHSMGVGVAVETDRLLAPVPEDWNQVLLRVTVKARRLIWGNMDLGS